jgi:hypothetical protein
MEKIIKKLAHELNIGEKQVTPTKAKTPAKAGKIFEKDFQAILRAFMVFCLSLKKDMIRKIRETKWSKILNKIAPPFIILDFNIFKFKYLYCIIKCLKIVKILA